MIGRVFGLLVVETRAPNNKGGTARWNCRCACGNMRTVDGTALRAGRNKSCGCASPKFTETTWVTHGASGTRAYSIFTGMHRRCSPKAQGKDRRNYWDAGIRVCLRWHLFESFIADMGPPPAGLTIDRIDGAGDYEPGNCRWATYRQQANNMNSNRVLDVNGEQLTIAMWARKTGINPNTIAYRLRRGCPPDRAVSAPIHKGVRLCF